LKTFEQLGLSPNILKALVDLGFETPSDIQEQAIPQLLEGDTDFIGLAQTGTGKTAAFGLPLLERIDPNNKATQGLILAPTRELGKQIAVQLEKFSKHLKRINVLAVYGGAAISNQISALRRPQHVIIATPGRLIDLIKRKAVYLDQLEFLVLDEADEMLNMGFKEELDKILSYTPEEKVTWLFSATMPNEIKKIVNTYMDDPIEVRINSKNKVNKNIEHQFVVVRQADKQEALTRFLDIHADMRGLVFCRTRRETQALAETLLGIGYKADALHGDLSQAQRDRVMKRFRKHDVQVLIATDVAARGIDVDDLSHVFHFTLPDDDAYYTHRSGRTARAGKKGISISFINGREKGKISRIERALRINFEQIKIPDTSFIADLRMEEWAKQILKTSGAIEKDLFDKIKDHFENLTKEELISKILLTELERLNLGKNKDLNANFSRGGSRDDRSRGSRGGRGGRSDRRSSDRRGRSSDRRSSDRRSSDSRRSSSDDRGRSSDRRSSAAGDSRRSGSSERRSSSREREETPTRVRERGRSKTSDKAPAKKRKSTKKKATKKTESFSEAPPVKKKKKHRKGNSESPITRKTRGPKAKKIGKKKKK